MQVFILRISCLGLIILASFGIYYGSYLPYMKMKSMDDLRTTARELSPRFINGATGEKIVKYLKRVNSFYSPVGSYESAEYTLLLIKDYATSNFDDGGKMARTLAEYAETLDLTDERNLMWLAEIYRVLWKEYHIQSDFDKSEQVYYRMLTEYGDGMVEHTSNTIILTGLFDLYYNSPENEKTEKIGKLILNLGDDPLVRSALGIQHARQYDFCYGTIDCIFTDKILKFPTSS